MASMGRRKDEKEIYERKCSIWFMYLFSDKTNRGIHIILYYYFNSNNSTVLTNSKGCNKTL